MPSTEVKLCNMASHISGPSINLQLEAQGRPAINKVQAKHPILKIKQVQMNHFCYLRVFHPGNWEQLSHNDGRKFCFIQDFE